MSSPFIKQSEAGDATHGELRVRAVTSSAELAGLGPLWDQLLEASETATPFQSFAWATGWLESLGAAQTPWVLVVEDDAGPAALAPLALGRRGAGSLGYRVVELIGTGPLTFLGMGLSDRTDLLLARRRAECAERIIAHLAAERRLWDIVDLRFLPRDGTTARVFREAGRAAGLGVDAEDASLSPYITLSGDYEGYLGNRSRAFRKGLKRRRRALEERGRLALRVCEGAELEQSLAAAVEVSHASWKAEAGSALLQHANVRAFFDRLLPRLGASDALVIGLLELDGEPIAHELDFRLFGKLWSYDAAFKQAFADGSPGSVLTAAMLEWAWSRGLEEFDFLRGDEGYKLSWGTESRREIQLVLSARTARARAARQLAFRAKWALKRSPRMVAVQAYLAGVLNRLRAGRG